MQTSKCEDFEVRFCCPKIESTEASLTTQFPELNSTNNMEAIRKKLTDITERLPRSFETTRKVNRLFRKSIISILFEKRSSYQRKQKT